LCRFITSLDMRQFKSLVAIILLLILIEQITVTNFTVLGQPSYSKRTYVSQSMGLQFQYPSIWGEPMDSGGFDCHISACNISFVIRDPLSRSIDLFIIRVDSYSLIGGAQESCNCKTLTDLVRWDYDRKFRTDNTLFIQNQTRVNSHHNAWQMELSSVSEKDMKQTLLVWTIDGNTGYRIQYSAPAYRFTEHLAGFEDMLKSFIFPEQSEAKKPTCLFNVICL
jgi:hypothetical protein